MKVFRSLSILLIILALGFSTQAFAVNGANEKSQAAQTELDPSSAQYHIALAKQEIAANNWVGAEKHLKKAKKIDPDVAETYQLLGDFHMAFSRDWKAKKFYKKAKELEAKNKS